MSDFTPKLITVLSEGYTGSRFMRDLTSGVLVGIVALPLAIAFAVASGCSPQQGIVTAIIAGFLISLLSGSRVQIGGPTGAFIVLVAAVVQQHGMEGLAVATVMAGMMLLLFGIFRLGSVISYIPYPVTVGFTSAIAVIILTGQIPHALGLAMPKTGAEFIEKGRAILENLNTLTPTAGLLTIGTVLLIIVVRRFSAKIPGALLALVLFAVVAALLKLPVETLGDRFGLISGSIPAPHFPAISMAYLKDLFPSALSIALLGGIESLLSAVVADGMTGYRHRPNAELVAQGIANIITPLFGGIPATGAIARTATNIKNGGTSPFSGIVHALTLLLILLFAGSLVQYIPFAVLAGILFVAAWNMGEWHLFGSILKGPKSDAAVLLSTFLLTLLIDLSVAIPVGVVLAALLFMKRMIDVSHMGFLSDEKEEDIHGAYEEGVEYFSINGPFFFGVSSHFINQMRNFDPKCKKLILNMTHVPAMDMTGLKALEDVATICRGKEIELHLENVQPQPAELLKHSAVIAYDAALSVK